MFCLPANIWPLQGCQPARVLQVDRVPPPWIMLLQTNYPAASYERVLPTLQAHSSEALVAAIRKDSQLAVRRTSK